MYNTLWYVGSIIAAWTVYGTIGYSGDAACKKSLETMSGGLSEAVAVLQRTCKSLSRESTVYDAARLLLLRPARLPPFPSSDMA